MPSPVTTEISLTVRFGVPIVPILPISTLALILDKRSKYYVIAYEQPGDETTGHYQCAVRLNEAIKVENTKQWLIRELKAVMSGFEWSKDNEKYAVHPKKHPDLECLAGGYCRKEDSLPFCKGWDLATLQAGEARYKEAKESKRKKIPVSKSAIVPLIRDYLSKVEERMYMTVDGQERWSKLTLRQRYDFIEKLMIVDGYDLSTISPLQISHIVKNWNEYFENIKNFENILDEFFE